MIDKYRNWLDMATKELQKAKEVSANSSWHGICQASVFLLESIVNDLTSKSVSVDMEGEIDLKLLRQHANKACEAAFKSKMQGAVNWADLSCISAREIKDDAGHIGLSVIISEASPHEAGLQSFIWDYLEALGYEIDEVLTEW